MNTKGINCLVRRMAMVAFVAFVASMSVSAQSWVDVTSKIISNSDFSSGNANGWQVNVPSAQNAGYQGALYSNREVWISGFIESWHESWLGGLGDGFIKQTNMLQPGRYRLSADCISSNQGNSFVNAEGVYLYARNSKGELSTTQVYTANNKPQHFTLEFTVKSADKYELGMLLEGATANWVAADNFTIEMNAIDIVQLKGIELTEHDVELYISESTTLHVKYSPSNTSFQTCTFWSEDSNIASVDADGTVTAQGAGETVIYAESKDGEQVDVCTVTVKLPAVHADAIVINEIQSSNVDMFLDPSMNYGSWIEIYNPTDKASGLGGLYISDDPADLKKYKIRDNFGSVPAHGYRNIWFDHYGIWSTGELKQVDTKLNYDGGTIIISDGVNIIAQQSYPQGIMRGSYARTTDGGSTWALSGTPTPEGSNRGMTFAETQLAVPVVSADGKILNGGSTTFTVTIPAGATLRYTTDGTAPTESSAISMDGRFTVNGSAVYRFRLFQNGFLPSDVVTRSFIPYQRDLPIISITTDDENLYSTERGLFQRGPNGRPGNGQDSNCNWNMEWDRPVNFEYFDENGAVVLNQEVDMSMCGGWSRANSPHSFKLKAAKYYGGKNSLDYQFFEGKPYLKHKVLQIRNGGSGDRLKDASLQEMMRRSGLYIDTQAWKPVEVYINGTYYAELNMREPNNKHFGYANYGIDTDFMDQFEMSPDSGYVQMAGTKDSFDQLIELSYDASDPVTYKAISELLDIDEYINYMAVELYIGNWDWPQNNVKAFRDQNNGKFHFVVYDLDGAFSADINTFFNKKYYTFDKLRGEDALGNSLWGQRIWQEIEVVTLFENLLENDDFRKRFIDAFCIIGGTVFDYDYAYSVAEEMNNSMSSNTSAWNLANNFNGRQSSKANEIRNDSRFRLNGASPQQVSLSSNADGAEILVNGMVVPMGKFSGKLFSPITLTAATPAGYKFCGWKLTSGNASTGEGTKYNIFDKGTTWTYDDNDVSLDGTAWKTNVFSKQGASPIGYDTNNSKTLSTHTNERLQTYYFSKSFNIDKAVGADDVFTLDYTVDDGMVVYVNGEEAGRYNMPAGEISFYTNGGWAQSNPDNGTMTLPAGLFKMGENIIAVEVHNFFNPTSSTDIYWNASLSQTKFAASDNSEYYSTDAEFTLPSSGDFGFVAEYKKLTSSEAEELGHRPVKVNEISANNDMYVNDQFKKDDWIELYNTTDRAIDVAGMYISDDEAQPQKFQIPSNDIQNTIIEPHSHLVLWASKRSNTGEQIHTNFKLSNVDGSLVVLTSEDGEWNDRLAYSMHGAKETVGLYPDGGVSVYHMDRPTIGAANTLTSYAQYLYNNIPEVGSPVFVLNLSEGWNWISHPLERNINPGELGAFTNRILSQTDEAVCTPSGWEGKLTSLEPGLGYKVLMNASDEKQYEEAMFNEANTIQLHKGWNWIGYPLLGNQNMTSAFSKFKASEGDQIIGQEGFATYENGTWSGSLEVLSTGTGYIYKSADTKSLQFTSADASASAKARFHAQPLSAWTANATAYPNVMGIVAKVVAEGADAESGAYSVGAFSEDGECRGTGKYIDGKLFITIYGEGDEKIVFRAADASTGIVYEVSEIASFAEEVKGSRVAPFALHIGQPTDIASMKNSSAFDHIEYYSMNGQYVGNNKNSLSKGIYVAKISLNDGGVISKKIIVR